jgi:hypothetical protein
MDATESETNIDPFATLIRKKLLFPSVKTPYIAVRRSFLVELLRTRVAQIHVDETWYLSSNPDVCRAVKDGAVKDGREHFVTSGYYEHRLPYKICVDEAWYLEQYEDVRQAVLAAIFPSGQIHFETLGYREGRLPFADFSLVCDQNENNDGGHDGRYGLI